MSHSADGCCATGSCQLCSTRRLVGSTVLFDIAVHVVLVSFLLPWTRHTVCVLARCTKTLKTRGVNRGNGVARRGWGGGGARSVNANLYRSRSTPPPSAGLDDCHDGPLVFSTSLGVVPGSQTGSGLGVLCGPCVVPGFPVSASSTGRALTPAPARTPGLSLRLRTRCLLYYIIFMTR